MERGSMNNLNTIKSSELRANPEKFSEQKANAAGTKIAPVQHTQARPFDTIGQKADFRALPKTLKNPMKKSICRFLSP